MMTREGGLDFLLVLPNLAFRDPEAKAIEQTIVSFL